MEVFLICVLGSLGMFSAFKGIFDIMMCVPYLPDRLDECKVKLISGLILFLIPVGAILLILHDLLTYGA